VIIDLLALLKDPSSDADAVFTWSSIKGNWSLMRMDILTRVRGAKEPLIDKSGYLPAWTILFVIS